MVRGNQYSVSLWSDVLPFYPQRRLTAVSLAMFSLSTSHCTNASRTKVRSSSPRAPSSPLPRSLRVSTACSHLMHLSTARLNTPLQLPCVFFSFLTSAETGIVFRTWCLRRNLRRSPRETISPRAQIFV